MNKNTTKDYVEVQNLRRYPNRMRRKRAYDKEELNVNVMDWIHDYYEFKDDIINDVDENDFYRWGYELDCNVVHMMDTDTLHISILDLNAEKEVVLEFDVPTKAIEKPLYVIYNELKKMIDF